MLLPAELDRDDRDLVMFGRIIRRRLPVRGTECHELLPVGGGDFALAEKGKAQHGERRRQPGERAGMHLAQHRTTLRMQVKAGETKVTLHRRSLGSALRPRVAADPAVHYRTTPALAQSSVGRISPPLPPCHAAATLTMKLSSSTRKRWLASVRLRADRNTAETAAPISVALRLTRSS